MDLLIGQRPASTKAGTPVAGDLIKDSSLKTFRGDVIDASDQVPVIVDFWATWCGPCKQLGPALEAAVLAAKGALRLVKIDVDKNPEIAQQMRIQSLPAVYAFFKGQPVDGFVGAVQPSQIKAFIARLTTLVSDPKGLGEILKLARAALAEDRLDEAEAAFGEVLSTEPGHLQALAGLTKVAVARGLFDQAEAILAQVPEGAAHDAEVVSARSALTLARQAAEVGNLAGFEAALAADPNDHQARFDLALGLIGSGQRQDAVDHLMDIVKRDRYWNEEAARKQLVQFFEAAGFDDPLAISGRRRLSTLLFS